MKRKSSYLLSLISYLLILLVPILITGCSESLPSNPENSNEISNQQSERKVMIAKQLGNDAISFESLDELAKILAINQNNYSDVMKSAMKYSKVKENILNISDLIKNNKVNNLEKSLIRSLDNVHSANKKKNSPKLSQLLTNLTKDINIYFPVKQHRENVLKLNQEYWVVFSTPIHDDNEYFVTGYNKNGEVKQFSSKIVPAENILVISYSEHQEQFTPYLLPCADCDNPGDGEFPGNGDDPGNPVPTELGLSVDRFKTNGIDDGWLDGDLEIRIIISQFTTVGSIGWFNWSIDGIIFMVPRFDHDAGTWTWLFSWEESNIWTTVNAKKRLSERVVLYNNETGPIYWDRFEIQIWEEDVFPYTSDFLASSSFDLNTFSHFGEEWQIVGNQIWIVLNKKHYPTTSFNF